LVVASSPAGMISSLDPACTVALCAVLALGVTPTTLGLLLLALVFRWFSPVGNKDFRADSKPGQVHGDSPDFRQREGLAGAFIPSHGEIIDLNRPCVHHTENEYCSVKFIGMTRPTDDLARDAAGLYAHAEHFKGRKRLWETRWQICVKATPKKPLFLGLELAEYVPVAGWALWIQRSTLALLRKAAGGDIYHSCGDSPQAASLSGGEAEKPVFAMPLWAFDQVIESEVGQEPDIRNIEGLGLLRTDGRKKFIKHMSQLELRTDRVYTFAFWCISQWVDAVNWRMLGVVPGGIDFNALCGRPPVHVVLYELDDASDPREKRHLQSRKKCYFNLALWSTKMPPAPQDLRKMLPQVSETELAVADDTDPDWCCWRR